MLSSVLNSKKAIQMNIQIMRVFIKYRQLIMENAELQIELDDLRAVTDEKFALVFDVLEDQNKMIKKIVSKEKKINTVIGFK